MEVPRGIRKSRNGSYWITKPNPKLEEWLNDNCVKDKGLIWWPKLECMQNFTPLTEYFNGKACYIVGKGPSLDFLSEKDFPDATLPVICINESIHKVEKLTITNQLFCMQQDTSLKDTCRPKRAILICSTPARYWYRDVTKMYTFLVTSFGIKHPTLTAGYAIKMALSLGTTSFVFLCFDACVNKKTAYAKCIGYECTRGGNPKRFLSHRAAYEVFLGNTTREWLCPSPETHDESSFYKLQPS